MEKFTKSVYKVVFQSVCIVTELLHIYKENKPMPDEKVAGPTEQLHPVRDIPGDDIKKPDPGMASADCNRFISRIPGLPPYRRT